MSPASDAAYSRPWRLAIALLVVIGWVGALGIVFALLFLETRLDNPLRLLRTWLVASFAPALAALLLEHAFAATVTVERAVLAVLRRDQRIEVPCEAVARLEPWRVPIPGAGLGLVLGSGRRLAVELRVADPVALVDAMVAAGASPTLRDDLRSPAAVYGRTRGAPRRWWQLLLQFPVFALVPALPVFRLHQWIAFGGTFGEYYTYGLQAYLLAFAMQWWTFTIHLVLYATVLRTLAELVVLAAARLVPARAAAARRVVERAYWFLYVAGVPAFLVRLAVLTS
jgi:apolipoprotein N-acyltransferase